MTDPGTEGPAHAQAQAQARASLRRLLRWLAAVLGPLLLLVGGWTVGLVWYASAIPVADPAAPPAHADAIVVLTGGSERVREGLALLERGVGDGLFISGVPDLVASADLWRELDVVPSAAVADRVVLGHAAVDTLGNAIETAAWARARGLKSLRLVTAAYHMPRAMLEFRYQMPHIRLSPHPVYPPHVKQETWWRFPGTAFLLASEYTKYLIARARIALGLTPRGVPAETVPPAPAPAPAGMFVPVPSERGPS